MEIELKFQIPEASRPGVARAVATASARVTDMHAVYADTADDRLARAGLALRLRREGARWVQTLKGRGDGLMQRLEHEVVLPGGEGTPALDPTRHAGTPAGAALMAALDGAALQPLYATRFRRTHRLLRAGDARIEVALDEGRIEAGRQAVALCEIEFELLSGAPVALLDEAARWVQRHQLWLDVRTKSERGFRLARPSAVPPDAPLPALSPPPGLTPGPAHLWRVQQALRAMLPRHAAAAAGTETDDDLAGWREAAMALCNALHERSAEGAATAAPLEARWAKVLATAPASSRSPTSETVPFMRDPALGVLLLQTWADALRDA